MFQVALISAISAAVLIASTLWSMRVRRGVAVPHEARRVLVAAERASWEAMKRRLLRLPWALGAALAIALASPYVLGSKGAASASAFSLASSALALCCGVLAALVVAWGSNRHVRSRAFLGVSVASSSADRVLVVTLSTATVLAVAAEVFGILSAVLVQGILWLLARGTADATLAPVAANLTAARLLPLFGIGSALVALGLAHSGIACVGASKLAGNSTFQARTGLSPLDPRNPSVLVEAVARQLGGIVPKVLDAFVGGVLVTTIAFQLVYFGPRSAWGAAVTSVAMLPLLVRAFGLLASLFGVLTLRTSEHEDLGNAFTRGQLVAHVVLGSSLIGLLIWLVGSVSAPVAVAALFGLSLASLLGRLRARLLAKNTLSRQLADDGMRNGAIASADAMSVGLSTAAWPLAVYPLGFALFGFWFTRAETSPLEQGVAILMALAVPSCLGAWNLAVVLGRDLDALGILSASVGRTSLPDDSTHRLRRLAEANERIANATEPVLSDAGVLLCGLTAIVCQVSHAPNSVAAPSMTALFAIATWVVLPVVLAAVAAFRLGARTARTQVNEVDRQLRGMRREVASVIVPEDFVPSYRSCVELLARDSALGSLAFAWLPLALPLLCAVLGALVENTPGLAAVGLASYASIAAAAGLFATQMGHAAAAASSLVNRGSAPTRLPASLSAVSVCEPLRLVSYLGQSLGVSVPLLTKSVALATLAFSPLLV